MFTWLTVVCKETGSAPSVPQMHVLPGCGPLENGHQLMDKPVCGPLPLINAYYRCFLIMTAQLTSLSWTVQHTMSTLGMRCQPRSSGLEGAFPLDPVQYKFPRMHAHHAHYRDGQDHNQQSTNCAAWQQAAKWRLSVGQCMVMNSVCLTIQWVCWFPIVECLPIVAGFWNSGMVEPSVAKMPFCQPGQVRSSMNVWDSSASSESTGGTTMYSLWQLRSAIITWCVQFTTDPMLTPAHCATSSGEITFL